MNDSGKFVSGQGTTISQCASCVHKHADGPTCLAFPRGIPDIILLNRFDHRNAYPGDSGIRYEPAKGRAT